tara:strand:- start:739 stop:1041 length:303 start_codon:yes stop_codon:yes gene_type:complete
MDLIIPISAISIVICIVPPILTATYRLTAAFICVFINMLGVIYSMCVSIEKASRHDIKITKTEKELIKETETAPNKTENIDIESTEPTKNTSSFFLRRRW